ncbi:MAG: ABC transporter permease [Eubacteriaceae bacterium]|nr:ABC transporter permease [Eubacteriaceae bacterium]
MKNPLNKRYLRELKSDFGKYAVIFIMLVISIGFCSGFLVADDSMIAAYNESFEKYNIENGNFVTGRPLNTYQKNTLEAEGLKVYPLFYSDMTASKDTTVRLFAERTEVNRVCLLEGAMATGPGEVAIDRCYANNNGIKIGDVLNVGGMDYRVSGFVALSDYSTMFSDNTDMMFDAVKFGVGIVPQSVLDTFDTDGMTYDYAFTYDNPPQTIEAEKERSDDLMKVAAKTIPLKAFTPRYANQAIMFTGDDMGSDKAMVELFLVIIIVIIAFVFAVTISDTITSESAVIGTLLASGYTRWELIRHYMAMPMIVSLFSAVVGNILGYTVFKDLCAYLYYNSYSLPTYITRWNAAAFLETTVIPLIVMLIITFFSLYRKLRLSPLKFLRRDLRRHNRKKAIPLSHKLPIVRRFRLRIIFQNAGGYLVMFFGILLANALLMFGLFLPATIHHYQDVIGENMLCEYQYTLDMPVENLSGDNPLITMLNGIFFQTGIQTDNPDAEKFSINALKSMGDNNFKVEDISVYGIYPHSQYVKIDDLGDMVYISKAYADKYMLSPGDRITLKEEFEDKTYSFEIGGIYPYEGAVCVFMPQKLFAKTFDVSEDYFSGYMSSSKITDVNPKYFGTIIDFEGLTKVTRQLDVSMGSMMVLLDVFAVLLFVVMIYLLSKLIIEKNAQSISMVKILGYRNREIAGLYLMATTIVVIISTFATLIIDRFILEILFRIVMVQSLSGWINIYDSPMEYAKVVILGLLTYGVVAALEYRKITRVPMSEALKNVE